MSPENSESTVPSEVPAKKLHVGTMILGLLALICFAISLVKGVVPIYLVEAAVWVGLAWYWQRSTRSEVVTIVVVGVLTLILFGSECFQLIVTSSDPHTEAVRVASKSNPIDDARKLQAQSQPQPTCVGMPAGVAFVEIPTDQVQGLNGELFGSGMPQMANTNDAYFHFSVINRTSTFCLLAIEYEIELQTDDGITVLGHGKKHIAPLSPGWSSKPNQRDDDDAVKFTAKGKLGTLKSWRITKAFGFPLSTTTTSE